jgi:hypothetical protein
MLDQIKQNKNMLMLLAVVIVIALLYFFVFKKEDPLVETSSSSQADIVGQDVINELTRLKTLVSMNTQLFSNPIFTSLKDTSVTVVPVSTGRKNPFLPVSGI